MSVAMYHQTSPAHSSTLDQLRVSIDAHTLDITAGKRRLRAVEPDGRLSYEDVKTPSAKLTAQLERIWSEYPDGLLDLTEDKLLALPPDAPAVEDKLAEGEKEKLQEGSKTISWEEMERLRSEIFLQLNDARNELWYVLELAKTLGQSTTFTIQPPSTSSSGPTPKKGKAKGQNKTAEPDVKPTTLATSLPGDPPILPPGTYTATPSLPPARLSHTHAYELELALAAKQKALEECSTMIDSAVEELRSMAEAGEQFWEHVRALKNGTRGKGQWAVLPKPDFGRTMVEREQAKDVIIPYAVDEAPPALRARCLAAFDLDPSKKESLQFGARSCLRLRVTCSDGMTSSLSTLVHLTADDSDVQGMMEAAQLEAFDEDLFNEIRIEALRDGSCVVEPKSVKVDMAESHMTFQLYDSRDPPLTPTTTSPLGDLIVLSARLSLSQLHQHRKQRFLAPSPVTTSPLPSILLPIIHILDYLSTIRTARSSLVMLSDAFTKAQIRAAVIPRLTGAEEADLGVIGGILTGEEETDKLGGTLSLEVQGCASISLAISPPQNIVVTTSRGSYPLTDLQKLPQIFASDITVQLLSYVESVLRRDVSSEQLRGQIFVDEMEEVVSIGQNGILRFSFPAPFDVIYASFTPTRAASGVQQQQTYDSREGKSLLDWVRSIARIVTTPDGLP